MPVSSDTWAFHASAGTGASYDEPQLAVRPRRHHLIGDRQADTATRRLRGHAPLADLPQQDQGLVGRAGGHRLRDLGVGELGPAADERPLAPGRHRSAVTVEVDAPQQRRTIAVGQQAGGALAQGGRVEGHAPVGPVQRHPTAVRLDVDGTARRDEGGDVRDGVPDPDAVAPAAFRPVGLVEVATARGVDGDQRDVGAVRVRAAWGATCRAAVVAAPEPRAASTAAATAGGKSSGTPCSWRTAAIPAATSPAGAPAARWIGGVGTPANLVPCPWTFALSTASQIRRSQGRRREAQPSLR